MKVILNESQYILLVESIKKEKYRSMMFSLLNTLLGKLSIEYSKDPNPIYHLIRDQYGENVMDIYIGKYANKGCKKDLTLPYEISKKIESYVPEHRHKTFSKVLVDYVYEQTGEKCDCVQYEYNFKWVPYENDDDDDDEQTDHDFTGHDESKTRKYNVKKKKKIKESVDGKSSLENLIYEFLQDDFYPDYNWGPELFDFYREDVKEYGLIPFYINDSEAYVYYDDGTLEIMPWVCEKLDGYFNDLWVPIFKSWFKENSGLKVKKVVTMDGVVKLNESTDKKQNVFSNQSSNNSIFVFNQTGTKGYYQAIPFYSFPDEFYNYVSSLGKDSESEVMDYLINRTYIEASGEFNRIHFREGIHPKLQGTGLGYTIYKDFIKFLGYGSSSENATKESKRVWEKLLESSDFYGVYGNGDNVLIASKNWGGDVVSLFKSFISKKCQGRVIKISNSLLSDYPEFNSYFENSINESIDKNKKFLIDIMGIDFTDKIQQITSSYDVPMEFDKGIGPDMVNRMLYFWASPMYLVNINGKKYLYQDRGDDEWFLDKEGYEFGDWEILEELGIGVMGLRFSDIIDIFFDEEKTTLNETVDKNKKFLIDYLGEDFINGIKQITSQYDIPYELKRKLDYPTLRRIMNYWGPMYLVKIKGKNYLYQNRDDYEWFMDNEGSVYFDREILEEIGIGVIGLKFSDIIDMFF